MSEELRKIAMRRTEEIMSRREEILEAFIAKYGCQPEELVLIESSHHNASQFFVMKKNEVTERFDTCPHCGVLLRPV